MNYNFELAEMKFDIPMSILKEYQIKEKSKFTLESFKLRDYGKNSSPIKVFKDITICIPFSCDTDDRLINLFWVLKYLHYYIHNPKIILYEMGNESKAHEFRNYDVQFLYAYFDEKFSKTKLINKMVHAVETEYFIIWDTDVFLNPKHLIFMNSMKEWYDVIIPYNGQYIEVHPNFIFKYDFDKIWEQDNIGIPRFSKDEYLGNGGCVLFRTEKFKKFGGMNEFFTHWGYEDDEIIYRLFELGCQISRIYDNPIYHIQHETGDFGNNHNHKFSKIQKSEYDKIKLMSYRELLEYVKTWNTFKEINDGT